MKSKHGKETAAEPTNTIGDVLKRQSEDSSRKPSDRKDVIQEIEPWSGRPLFVTMDGETRRISNDIEGLPRAVVVAIKRNKAAVVSPARYPKDKEGQYVQCDIDLADGTKYQVTLTHPVCWIRAPGDRERALIWGLRKTGMLTRADGTGDYLIIPKDRSGQRAWVPKEDSRKQKGQRVPREAFRAYPVSTEGLVKWLRAELAFTNNAFDGHERCRSSWLLLTEQNHAIEAWQQDEKSDRPFNFEWVRNNAKEEKK